MAKLKLSDVNKKHAKLISYLTLSGGLGYVLATYVAKDTALTAIFAPAINYCLYALEKEVTNSGYREALKNI